MKIELYNKSEETNQKPAGGFLIAHFKRYIYTTITEKERKFLL